MLGLITPRAKLGDLNRIQIQGRLKPHQTLWTRILTCKSKSSKWFSRTYFKRKILTPTPAGGWNQKIQNDVLSRTYFTRKS